MCRSVQHSHSSDATKHFHRDATEHPPHELGVLLQSTLIKLAMHCCDVTCIAALSCRLLLTSCVLHFACIYRKTCMSCSTMLENCWECSSRYSICSICVFVVNAVNAALECTIWIYWHGMQNVRQELQIKFRIGRLILRSKIQARASLAQVSRFVFSPKCSKLPAICVRAWFEHATLRVDAS